MRILTKLSMSNATWERFKELSSTPGTNPFFTDGGSYQPYQGVQIEVTDDVPDGVLEPTYVECVSTWPARLALLQSLLDPQFPGARQGTQGRERHQG